MRFRLVTLGGAATVLGLAAGSLVVTAPATAAPSNDRARSVAELKRSSDRTPTLTTDQGVVSSMRTAPGHPVDRPAGVRAGASAEAAARGFAKAHGAAFGLRNGDATLRTESTTSAGKGLEVVRFRQTVGTLPILGADVVTTVNAAGETVAVNSTATTATAAPTTARVSAQRAAATARSVTIDHEKLPASAHLTVAAPELVMFDPAVFGVPARPGMRPVWQVQVKGATARGPIASTVLVDATVGEVSLYTNALREAENRQVCDHNNTPVDLNQPGGLCPEGLNIDAPVAGGNVEAVEGTVNAGAADDVQNAYVYAGDTYNFYDKVLGRNSIDGNGMQIRSSVRYCPSTSTGGSNCYANAFWDGDQMVYGPGYASADDVVGHELTHGVTEHTASLFYWYQSGAINESMSDVFGEFIDLTNGHDGTGVQTPWMLGEDLPGGAIRSMSDPESTGDPGSMTSAKYVGDTGALATFDNGGVHTNSGVGNHAAYLIATGLGGDDAAISKAAHIYYQTLLTLPSGADYADLADALESSCTTLANGVPVPAITGPDVTITTADCAVVTNAIATTQMRAQPTAPGAAAPEAATSPDGSASTTQTLFSDDMENTSSDNWVLPRWADPWDAMTYYFDPAVDGASYAHSGKISLVGFTAASGTTSAAGKLSRITAAQPLTIPTGKQTFLWFAHADVLTDGRNDGGRVNAIYTEGGVTHTVDVGVPDASTRPAANGYTTTLTSDGRPAFSGDSHGYVSSRFELTRFAGKSIKLAFDTVGDGNQDSNWWLDDVRVYTCTGPAPSLPENIAVTPAGTSTATVSWTKPEWAGDSGIDHYTVTVDGTQQQPVADDGRTGAYTLPLTGLSTSQPVNVQVAAYETVGDQADRPRATAVLVPTVSTLNSSAGVATYGSTVTVSGIVTRKDVTSTRLGSGLVTVRYLPSGTSVWTTIGTVRADANGAWKFAYRPSRNGTYYAVVPTAPGRWAGTSNRTVAQSVMPKVAATFKASTIRRGQTASMSVAVAPARKYTVELQRRSGSKWVVVQRRTTLSTGKVILSDKPRASGSYSYRVVTRGDTYNRATASSSRALRVR